MEKLYYQDTYLKETQCVVLSVNRTDKCTEVLTDKTVFYPECGGQPGDRGFIGPYEIMDTRKADNGDSVLILAKDSMIEEGKSYSEKLDWAHRYKYMKMHAAQHILSGLLFTQFNVGTVAVHLGEDYLTIEVSEDSVSQENIEKLIKIANEKIAESHKIVYHEMSHGEAEALGLRRSIKVEGDVRIVEIEDVDRIACGGVHVAKTSEIGLIVFTGTEQIRGHLRLFFKAGDDALDFVAENQKTLSAIRDQLSCSDKEILPKIRNTIGELAEAKRELSELSVKLAEGEVSAHIENGVAVMETSLELSAFGKVVEKQDDIALLVYNGNRWLLGLKGRFEKVDFNTIKTVCFQKLGAKGGGRYPLFQGIYTNKEGIGDFIDIFRKGISEKF